MLDALDRTVSETETHSGATTTTQTVYQGDSSAVSKETLSGAQSETKTYAYDASGNAITLSDATGGTTNRYSYLYDPRSSVSMLLDSTGAAKESYGYSAYGSKNASISKSASGFSTGSVPTNPVRFQGKRFDSGSGSYDMGARRYSATTGRWLSQDIYYGALDNLGLSQDPLTANRYAFLGANPINYVEADGHTSISCLLHGHLFCGGGTQGDAMVGKAADKVVGTVHKAKKEVEKHATLSAASTVLDVASTVAYGACAFTDAVGCGVGMALSAASSAVLAVEMGRKCHKHGVASTSCGASVVDFGVSALSTVGPSALPAKGAQLWRLNGLANLTSIETQVTVNHELGKKKPRSRK